MLSQIQPGPALDAEWPRIAQSIVAADPSQEEVRRELGRGHMQAWRVVGEANGYVITTTGFVRGTTTTAMWITYVAGHVRAARQTMAALGAELEQIARKWACKEMRVEGVRAGQWLRVLKGFAVIDRRGDELVIRKVLT